MSFNHFQVAESPRNFLRCPSPGSAPLSWSPTNNFGNIQTGVGNPVGNNSLIYLGMQGGYAMTSGWILNPYKIQRNGPTSSLVANWANLPIFLHGMGSNIAPSQGPVPFYSQNVPLTHRRRCRTYNATGYLEYPQHQIALNQAPNVQGEKVEMAHPAEGPSMTSNVDFPPNQFCKPDSSPIQVPEAGLSSHLRAGKSEATPSVDGCEKQLKEMTIAETHRANPNNKKSTSGRKQKRMLCGLCYKNGRAPDVYLSHNTTNGKGITTCPDLRQFVCPCCKKTGNKAHTLKFCPININNRRHFKNNGRNEIEVSDSSVSSS